MEKKIEELYQTFLRKSDDEEFVNLKKASRITGFDIQTLRRSIEDRTLPATKLRPKNSPHRIWLKNLAEFCFYGYRNGIVNSRS
ncbi:MAG: hypothetical protein K8S87_01920 [Planctomycetes bacterium]|nr:hypothetical protein [Planctomycetota bacterium]